MVTSVVCSECGERNEVGATFCSNCHAYLRWDKDSGDRNAASTANTAATNDPDPYAELASEMTMVRKREPSIPRPEMPVTHDTAAGRFTLAMENKAVTVPATGEPAAVAVEIANTSNIVDGYRVVISGAPGWLLVDSGQLQLLPGTRETLPVQLRIVSPALVPAQRFRAVLQVHSTVQDSALIELPLDITVPVVEAPVQLRAEPQLVRVRDQDTAESMIMVDNSRSNRPVSLTFSGSDAELAVRFSFQPKTLEVGPGRTGSVRMMTTARGPEPGQELTRALTVTADDGTQRVETQLTLQQTTSAADPPVAIEVVPSLVRLHDADVANVRVVLDNRNGRAGVRLWMGGSDPEQAVHFTYNPPVVDVAPGRVVAVDLQLNAPRPQAGQEQTRPFTVTAGDGRRTVQASASLVQTSSRAAIDTLTLSLDPSVLNLGHRRRGSLTAVLDNRAGAQPASVSLYGDDPRNALRFDFSPSAVQVPPGRTAAARVTVRAPGPQTGREVTLPFDVIASDGRSEIRSSGSVIQAAADPRPLLRIVFTLVGGLLMILGTYLPLRAGDSTAAAQLNGEGLGNFFGFSPNLGQFDQFNGLLTSGLLTVGVLINVLGVLVMVGLAGAKGKLSRGMAVLGLIVVIGLLIASGIVMGNPIPGAGAIVIILGCIAGFIGGRLIRR